MNKNIYKVADDSKVGFHYMCKNNSIKVTKNQRGSWVVTKDGVEVESFGIASNALDYAVNLMNEGA